MAAVTTWTGRGDSARSRADMQAALDTVRTTTVVDFAKGAGIQL